MFQSSVSFCRRKTYEPTNQPFAAVILRHGSSLLGKLFDMVFPPISQPFSSTHSVSVRTNMHHRQQQQPEHKNSPTLLRSTLNLTLRTFPAATAPTTHDHTEKAQTVIIIITSSWPMCVVTRGSPVCRPENSQRFRCTTSSYPCGHRRCRRRLTSENCIKTKRQPWNFASREWEKTNTRRKMELIFCICLFPGYFPLLLLFTDINCQWATHFNFNWMDRRLFGACCPLVNFHLSRRGWMTKNN